MPLWDGNELELTIDANNSIFGEVSNYGLRLSTDRSQAPYFPLILNVIQNAMCILLTKVSSMLNVVKAKGILLTRLFCVFLFALMLQQCDYLEEKRMQEISKCRTALEREAAILNLSNDEKLWFYAAILDPVGVAEMMPLSINPSMEYYVGYKNLSPLTISLQMHKPNDVAKMLVEHGVPLTSGTGRQEISALHRAARLGKTEIVELLLCKGALVNSFSYSESVRATDDDAYTPLMLACDSYATIRQHQEILESPWALETMLLLHGADINASTPEHQRTALHHAIFNSNADPLFINFLCESGADVNAQDKWGMTPYMYCCLHDKTILAAVLQVYGVNRSLRNVYGYTADEISCMHRGSDFPEWASAAFQSYVKLRRLCSHAEGFDTSTANQLLPHLTDINTPDATGRTLLSVAVGQRNVEAVRWLLSKGANPNASSGGFYTKAESIMELACNCDDSAKRFAMVQLLVDAGADIKAVFTGNNFLSTPEEYLYLVAAARNMSTDDWYLCMSRAMRDLSVEDFEKVWAIIVTKTDIDINTPDSVGYTLLLRYCADVNHLSSEAFIKLLLQRGARAGATLPDGRNAIMLLCSRSQVPVEAITLLASAGCPVDAVDSFGNSATSYLFNSTMLVHDVLDICKALADMGAFREHDNINGELTSAMLRKWGVRKLMEEAHRCIPSEMPEGIKGFMQRYKEIANLLR